MEKLEHTYMVIFKNTIEKDKTSHSDFADLPTAQAFAGECKAANTFYGLCSIRDGKVEIIECDYKYDEFLVETYIDGLPNEYYIEERSKAWHLSSSKVVESYLYFSLVIVATIAVSVLVNYYSPYQILSSIATCLATFFYSASTLGYLVTWKVQSLHGETPPENLNANILKIGYVLGTVFTVLGLNIG